MNWFSNTFQLFNLFIWLSFSFCFIHLSVGCRDVDNTEEFTGINEISPKSSLMSPTKRSENEQLRKDKILYATITIVQEKDHGKIYFSSHHILLKAKRNPRILS